MSTEELQKIIIEYLKSQHEMHIVSLEKGLVACKDKQHFFIKVENA